MLSLLRLPFSVALAVLTAAQAAPTKLTLSVAAGNGPVTTTILVFDGSKAWEFGPAVEGSPAATYDLHAPSWTEANDGQITLEKARAWAGDSKQRALASLGRVSDPDQKAFTALLLEPRFEVSQEGGTLRLDSHFITYVANEPLAISEELRADYFKYDELNAYRKAMIIRRTPPFVQLSVASILQQHALVPGHLVMTLRTPGGTIEVVTRAQLGELSSAELTLIRALPR
jgi:hypothetical protein